MKLFKDDVKFELRNHTRMVSCFELLDINKNTVAYAEKK
jgi:hypothetical protein